MISPNGSGAQVDDEEGVGVGVGVGDAEPVGVDFGVAEGVAVGLEVSEGLGLTLGAARPLTTAGDDDAASTAGACDGGTCGELVVGAAGGVDGA